jgi:hypothetical protein
MSRTYREVIESREAELEAVRGKYQEAKAKAAGHDGSALLNLARLLRTFQAGDTGEKAIYIVSQATMLVNTMAEPFIIVDAYEARTKSLEELRNQEAVQG